MKLNSRIAMKKLLGIVLLTSSLIVSAQDDPRLPKYSNAEELVFSDTFLATKHRLYPTGIQWAGGKQYVQEGSRWIDIDGKGMEVVSTTAGSEGLIDSWEVKRITWNKKENRVIFWVKYLTVRWPDNNRAGKFGTLVMELNSNMQIETMSFNIADEGYTGIGETLYIYRFMQKVPEYKYEDVR